ncbi:tetratricopeptide repeat protein [Thermostilla marina]
MSIPACALLRRTAFVVCAVVWLVLPSSAFGEEAEAVRQYNAAVQLQNVGSYDLAAEAWEGFLKAFPDDERAGPANYYLGVCRYQQKQFDRAAEAFRRAAKDFPNLKPELREPSLLYYGITLYESARAAEDAKKFAQCADIFTEFLKTYPQSKLSAQAVFYRAESLYMAGRKDEAAAAYRDFLARYPDDVLAPEVLYALGVCEEERNQPAEAQKLYAQFLANYDDHPLRAEVALRQGEVLFAAGKYAEAADAFADVAADPQNAGAVDARIRQADCLLQLKRYAEAAAMYAASVSAGGEIGQKAALAAGRCYYLAGEYDKAIALLRRAASLPAQQSECAHWIARCLLKKGETAAALKEIEQALRDASGEWKARLLLDRGDVLYADAKTRSQAPAVYLEAATAFGDDDAAGEALYAAAYAALESGDVKNARSYAADFLKRFPKHALLPDVLHIEAECLLLDKNYDEAARRYSQLIQDYGTHADVLLWHTRLATALSLAGKHQEVVTLLTPLVEKTTDPTRKAEMQLLIGAAQLELGNLAEAAKALEASTTVQPKGPHADRALLLAAAVYKQQNDPAKAAQTVRRLLADFPQSPLKDQALLRLAEYAYAAGDTAAAEAAYRQLIRDLPDSPLRPQAAYQLACLLLNDDKTDEAETLLAEFLEQYGNTPLADKARLVRGIARQKRKDYAGAIDDLQKALSGELTPQEQASARYAFALALIGQKDYTQAVAALTALLENPGDEANTDEVLYQLAWAYKLAGQDKQAVDTFRRLAADHPQSTHAAEAHYHLGEALYAQGDYGKAAVEYYTAMKQAKDADLGEKASHRLGWAYFKAEQFDKAQQTFAYQRATYPKGPLAVDGAFMEAESLFKLGKFAEASAIYRNLPPLTDENFEILRLLHAGQAAGRTGDWQTAVSLLSECEKRFPQAPELPEVLYELGFAYQNLGKTNEAEALYARVIQAADDETGARAQFMIGELQFARKDYAEAVKSFFKVAYGYVAPQWQADATFEAARCFELLKKPQQAAKLYRELIEKYPQSNKVNDAKAKLEALGG